MITCGSEHYLFVDPNGFVWASGLNDLGQLGLGHTANRQNMFCRVSGVPCAVQVSAAIHGSHSAIVDHQGGVWTFGLNTLAQTGIGVGPGDEVEPYMIASPTKVPNLPKICMVSCGRSHSIVLDNTGCIWGVGDCRFGQLSTGAGNFCIGEFTRLNVPNEMGRIAKIYCGYNNSFAQSEADELWGTGYNVCGELGVGNNENVHYFQKIPQPIQVKALSCGRNHTAILDQNGGVWVTGIGNAGQLGSGAEDDEINTPTKLQNIPPMVCVICGADNTLMIDSNGKVYVCGANTKVKFIPGYSRHILSPQMIPDLDRIVQGCTSHFFSFLVDDEGGVWVNGCSGFLDSFTQLEADVNRYQDKFIRVEGARVNTANVEKRFQSTKRAR